jgi:hypothetical protein
VRPNQALLGAAYAVEANLDDGAHGEADFVELGPEATVLHRPRGTLRS